MHNRRRPAVLLLSAMLAIALLAGCDTAALHDLPGRAAVINPLLAAMDRFQFSAYRAEYRLADGTTAVVAHRALPQRSVYIFSSGRYLMQADYVAACTGARHDSRCTLTNPNPDIHAAVDVHAIWAASGNRYVPVQRAITMLTDAAHRTDTALTPYRRMIDAHRTHCVSVRSAHPFRFCVTSRGVLASFAGRLDGHRVAVKLTHFTREPGRTSFRIPDTAQVTDDRSTT